MKWGQADRLVLEAGIAAESGREEDAISLLKRAFAHNAEESVDPGRLVARLFPE